MKDHASLGAKEIRGWMNRRFENQMNWKTRFLGLVLTGSIALGWAGQTATVPPAQQTARPAPPTRDPHTPGYVHAKELPDGTVPPPNADGNFILGPTHTPAPEMTAQELTHGIVVEFTMSSADSKYLPGHCAGEGSAWHARPERPGKARSDHEPSRFVYAQGYCVCAEGLCAGQRGPVHCGRGRTGSNAFHRAGWPDPRNTSCRS